MNTRMLKMLATTVLVSLPLAGCATGDTTEVEGGAKIVEEGKLTVCTHLPYKPFEFNQGGEVVGFDIDLMDLVSKVVGVEQEIVDTPFEGI